MESAPLIILPEPQFLEEHSNAKRWLVFQNPTTILRATHLEDVLPTLSKVDQAIENNQYVAGFITYEAAPAFEPAMHVVEAKSKMPLVWFGVFEKPTRIASSLEELTQTQIFRPSPTWTPEISLAQYRSAIEEIQRAIANGLNYQVNYTFRLRSEFKSHPWEYFVQLYQQQPTAYAAYVEADEWVVCSVSPELFFSWNQPNSDDPEKRLMTKPMKGTAARGKTEATDQAAKTWLQASLKNRAENVMIVDVIRNDLSKIAKLNSLEVTRLCQVETYPSVHQMTSTVSAKTNVSLSEMFRCLFPCASITGAPKIEATKTIAYLEQSPREIYCGSIGIAGPGFQKKSRFAQFNVAIRTLLLNREIHQAEYGTGGAITWDSRWEEEYQESQMKSQILHGVHSLLETLLWCPQKGYILLEEHLTRLKTSSYFFRIPFDLDLIKAALADLPKTQMVKNEPYKVRLTLSRDTGIFCTATLLDVFTPNESIQIAKTPIRSTDLLLQHKTTNRKIYEQLLKEHPDATDVILWNEREEITETTRFNILIQVDESLWITPPQSCGLLAGTFRNALLFNPSFRKALSKIGIATLQEQIVSMEAFQRASKICIINSLRGAYILKPAVTTQNVKKWVIGQQMTISELLE